MPPGVYTIGHSNHPQPDFIRLLMAHGIQTVVDVRSHPASRIHPHFDKSCLEAFLLDNGIQYEWLGALLGGRPNDASCYRQGQVDYTLLRQTENFRNGITVLNSLASKRRVAVVCSEKDPLQCHRGLAIAPELESCQVPVVHILADGTLETHGEAMLRLCRQLRIPDLPLFSCAQDAISEAIRIQQSKIAYRR